MAVQLLSLSCKLLFIVYCCAVITRTASTTLDGTGGDEIIPNPRASDDIFKSPTRFSPLKSNRQLVWLNQQPISVETSTTLSTTVITLTCTASTTACAGRRRRQALLESLLDQQFELDPSPVSKIEPTAALIESRGIGREEREAVPQYFLIPPSMSVPNDRLEPSSPAMHVEPRRQQQPNFDSNGYLLSALFNRSFNPYTLQQSSSLARQWNRDRRRTITFMATKCIVSTTWYTSYVACSFRSNVGQCAQLPSGG